MKKIAVALALSALLITGCASTGEQNGRLGGAAAGIALGALVGDAVDCKGCALIFGALGGLIGGAAGGEIGRRMDEHDAMMTRRSFEHNRTGQTTMWRNPDSNVAYDVTPTRTWQKPSGQFCREVRFGEAKVGEQRQEVYSTACRQADGSWKLQ